MRPLAWGVTVEAVADPNATTPIPTKRRLWPTPLRVQHVDIFALPRNTDRVYVGDLNVEAISSPQAGVPLLDDASQSYDDVDVSLVWIHAVVVGEGVSCHAIIEDDVIV